MGTRTSDPRMKKSIVGLFALIVSAGMLLVAPSIATAAEKVGICHRTASDTNPYVFIEVSVGAAEEGESLSDHLANNDTGHKPLFWKTDGTFRGEAHVAGDPKDDYEASGPEDCEDTEVPDSEPTGFLSSPSCPNQTVTATVENPTDAVVVAHVFINGEPRDSFEVAADSTASGSPLAVVDGDVVELFIGDSTEASDSVTVDLDCDVPPGDEPVAALIQGDCVTMPVLTLTNPTDAEVTFSVNGSEVTVAAASQQNVSLSGFGNVVVTVGEDTILDAVAVVPEACVLPEGGTNPPPIGGTGPTPSGLPFTL